MREKLFLGHYKGCHCQGFAIDTEHRYAYHSYAYPTKLVKIDMEGNVIGSVENIKGHLGCIDYCDEDGKLYASVERKGWPELEDMFFVAIFDVNKIDRLNMDAEQDDIMRVIRLKTVEEDYAGNSISNGKEYLHKYGCSGIDGLTIGPDFGADKDSKRYLHVCVGIFGDTERVDNDHQIILQYEFDDWWDKAKTLSKSSLSDACIEENPRKTYYVYTGNTTWGIQNFEYDEYTGDYFAFVYAGKKPGFTNYNVFFIDGAKKAEWNVLKGKNISGWELSLRKSGTSKTGAAGSFFPSGSMGAYSLGDGRFYFVEHDNSDIENVEINAVLYRLKEEDSLWLFEKEI